MVNSGRIKEGIQNSRVLKKKNVIMKKEINITWLYPKEMSIYGDTGNIIALKRRGGWRGFTVNVDEVGLREEIRDNWTDIYFFGGGQDQSQIEVAADLAKYKKKLLIEEARNGKVFLGICGGYQLYGHYYRDGVGNTLEGLGILDVHTVAGTQRLIGNLLVDTNFLKERLVGFENHSGKSYLGEKAVAFGKVIVGSGNNGEDRSEGAIEDNVFGCYLHGPVLPKNPTFADHLLKLAVKKKYQENSLSFLNDTDETLAHETAVQRAIKTH